MVLGVIEKNGAHLSFGGEHLGQGRERAREAILAQQKLADSLRDAVLAASPDFMLASRFQPTAEA